MIEQHIYIKQYKWNITVLYNVGKEHLDKVFNILVDICDNEKHLKEAINHLLENKINTGFIYSNLYNRTSLITIGKVNSAEEFIDTVVHEANHLQSHIATYYDLDEKGEEVCYIIGNIVKQMYSIFKKIIC